MEQSQPLLSVTEMPSIGSPWVGSLPNAGMILEEPRSEEPHVELPFRDLFARLDLIHRDIQALHALVHAQSIQIAELRRPFWERWLRWLGVRL